VTEPESFIKRYRYAVVGLLLVIAVFSVLTFVAQKKTEKAEVCSFKYGPGSLTPAITPNLLNGGDCQSLLK
jgi:hypothetical protein